MKAKLKTNYCEIKTGCIFLVKEIVGSRCSLLINNKIVDFGVSEVEIIINNDHDLFEVGQDINLKTPDFKMRNSDIEKSIKNFKYPLSKKLIKKAINHFLYN